MDGEMDGLVEAQIMISEKGKHLLTINRFKFCISHRLKDGSVQWRCSKKNTKCPAKLYTSGEDFKTILKFDLNHNHEPEKHLERQQLSNSIKRKASSDLYERPSKIIQRELRECSSSATGNITVNDLHLIRKNIYKCIKNQIPTLPKDLKEVFPSLEDVQPKTAKNEPLLLKENNKKTTGRENKTTKDEANKAVTNSVYKPTPPPHVKPTTSSAAKSASKPSANLQPLKKPPSASVPKTRAVPPPGQSAASSRVPSRIPNVKSNGLLNGEKRGGVGGGREGGVEKEEGKRWFFGRRNSKDSRDGGGRGRNEIKSISKSTTCLNNNTIETRKQVNGKPRRPSSVVESQNITIKRGGGQSSNKNADLNQLPLPGSLSRTSSVNDINNHQDPGKSSRDRLDRIAGEKSKDKKALSKNNNKIETDEPSSFQSDRQELEILQRQLQEMANEKTTLALQLGEHKGQLAMLQNEIAKLKMFQDQSNNQLEQLTEENSLLRNRLRDVAHSPLSDNEKQQLLYESHRHHSSAPASIATNVMDEHNGGDITTCPTPEWDKQSSGNVSEISVACLQDKINQMQETHYSTHEELQATLQELTDLQRQLLDHQHLTARLTEEKTLMFDSLCRQTERLTDARREVDALRHVLYSSHSGPEGIEQGQAREAEAEREEREAWLQEREELVQERERAAREAEEAGRRIRELDGEVSGLRERVGTLEGMVDAGRDERRRVEKELGEARDEASGKVIEMDRLRDLLDIARTKITELEQDRTLSDKSEMDELLDNTRKEKDALEAEVADLREQLARSKNETEKLREQVSILQEECKVIRNNAKTTQSDLEYKNERLQFEKTALTEQLQQFQDAVDELQVQSQCQSEDKRQLSAVLSETQRNLSESERKIQSLEDELAEVQKLRKEENEEWEKFQNDLLTSVRVANDFKTEAQQDLQKMIMENKAHRDRVRQLESQIDKLKGDRNDVSAKKKEEQTGAAMMRCARGSPSSKSRSKSSDDLTRIKTGQKNVLVVTEVKKRDKSLKKRREKALSKEEKQILSQLNDLYMDIDINVPSDQLNDEQKAIRDLKRIYDSEMTNRKPVAPTSKDKLAISKPLLGSVYKNPKLQSIASDPRFLTVEQIEPIDDDDNLDSAVTYKSRADDEALIVKYKASPWRSSDRKSNNKDRNNLHKVRSEYFQNQNETNDDYMEKQLTKSYSCDEIFPSSSGGKDRRPIPQGLLRISSTEELNNYVDTRSGTIDKARASTAIDKPFYSENSLNLLLRSSSSSSAELNRSDDITIVKPRAAASKTSLETIDLNLEKKPEPPEPTQPNKIEDKSPKSRFISRISIPKVKLSFLNKKPPPVKKIKNDYNVTFETLEEICQDIDPNADDEKLSKEQLFAKKLLLSLNEFGRKGTLKRIAKVRKQKIVISSPIQSSAVITDNPKLLSVLKDPEPRPKPRSNNPYRHSLYSALENCAFEEEEPKERLYKSYDDINFTFDREKGLRSPINMYSDEDITKNNVKSSDNSSSGSTTSGEFFVNKNVNETVNKRVIMRTFSVGSDGEKSFQRVELSSGRFIFEVDQGVEELSSQKEENLPKGDEMDDKNDSQVPVPVPVVIFDQNLELDVEDIEDVTVDAKVEVLQDDEGKIEEEFNKDIQDEVVITTNEVTEGKTVDLEDKNEEIESKHEVEEEHNEEIAVEYNNDVLHKYNKTTEDKSAEDLKNKSEETALEYKVEEHNEEIAVKFNHEDVSKCDRAAEDKSSEDLNKIIVENNEENKFCEEDQDDPNEEIWGKNNKGEDREYNNEIEVKSAEEIENNSGEEGKFEDANEEIIEKRFIEEFEQNSSEEIEDKRELGLKSDEKNEEFKENHIEEVQGRSDFEDRSSEDIIKIKTGEELINDVIEVESKVFEDSNEELYEECEDSYEENETETGEYKSEFAQESEDGNNEEIEDRYPVNEDTESEEQGNHILLPEDKYIDHLFAPIGADLLEETSPADSLQYNNDTIDYKLQKYGAFSEEEEEEEYEIPLGVHAAYKNVVQEMKKRCSDAKKPETAIESNEDSEDSEDDDYNESRANIFNEESKREIVDFIENERIISSISDETSAEMHRVKGLTSSEKDLLECVNQRYSVVSEMNDSDWEFVDQMRKKYQARDGDDEFYVPIDDRQNEDESSRNHYENVEISPRIIIEEEKPSVIPKRPIALPRRQKIAEIEVNDTSDNSSQDSEEETYCSCNVDWSSPVSGESVNPVEFQMTGDCSISIPNNYSEIMTDDDKSNNEDVKVVEQNFSPGRDMESSPQNTTEVIDSNIRAIFNSRLTKKLDDLIDDEQASASAENADHKSDSAPPIREVKKFSSLFQELPQAKEEEDTAFGFAVPVPVSESNGSSEIMHHNETSPINDSHINLFRPNSETSLNDSSQNVNRNKVYEDLNGQRCKYNVTIASTLPYEETTRIKCDDDKSDKIKTNDSMTKVSRLKSIFESKSKDTDLLTKSDTKTMKVDCKVSSGAIPKTTRSRLNRSVDSDDSLIAAGLTSRFGRRDYDTKGSFSKAKKVFERLEDHRSVDSDNFKFYPEVPVEGNSQYRETVNEVLHPDEFGQFLGAVDSFEIHEEKIRERNDNLILQKEREENFILQPIGEDNSAAFSSRNYKRKIILTEDDRVAPSPVVVDKSLSSEEQFERILEAVKKDSLKKLSSSKRGEDEEVAGSGGGGSGNETFRKEEQLSSVLFDRNRDSVIGNSECGVVNPVKYDYDINEEI